jgi:hypothetical protein
MGEQPKYSRRLADDSVDLRALLALHTTLGHLAILGNAVDPDKPAAQASRNQGGCAAAKKRIQDDSLGRRPCTNARFHKWFREYGKVHFTNLREGN